MARYNAWANDRLYTACAALPEAEYMKARGAFFGSIHGTLNHILLGDKAWMGRLEGVAASFDGLDQILHDDFAGLSDARTTEDRHIATFTERLRPAHLEDIVTYRNHAGEAQETPVRWILTHMLNHATHHRGQVHGMLSQVPVDPPPLDLIYFMR